MSREGFGYDRLARLYLPLERFAFGSALQEARLAYVDRLEPCRNVLTLGEGDGRYLAAATRRYPHLRATAVDASAQMIHRAERRVSPAADVRFEHADLRTFSPPIEAFDAVVGCFVWDQFTADSLGRIVPKFVRSLRPGGVWLHVDFSLPESGWRRWRARAWLSFLYGAFGAVTDIEARSWTDVGPTLERAGLVRVERSLRSHGLLESAVYRKDGAPPDGIGVVTGTRPAAVPDAPA